MTFRRTPKSAAADENRRKAVATFQIESTEIEESVRALMKMVEAGNIDSTDPDTKKRFTTHKARRQKLIEQIRDLELQIGAKDSRLRKVK